MVKETRFKIRTIITDLEEIQPLKQGISNADFTFAKVSVQMADSFIFA